MKSRAVPADVVDEFQHNYGLFYPEHTERLHAMLIHCGHACECRSSYRWDGLKRGSREMVIWQYTLSGRGELRFGTEKHAVEPGRAMVLIVPEDHCYYLPSDSDHWEFLYVTVTGSELVRLAREYRKRNGYLVSHARDSEVVLQGQKIIDLAAKQQIPSRYMCSALGYDFWMRLLNSSEAQCTSGRVAFMDKIYRYAMKHLAEDISVDDLARIAGKSRWHFSRLFHEHAGIAPAAFLKDLRMRLAIRLLQTTDKSVKEIGMECGFEDASYFCRVFSQTYGTTPEGFRSGKTASRRSVSPEP